MARVRLDCIPADGSLGFATTAAHAAILCGVRASSTGCWLPPSSALLASAPGSPFNPLDLERFHGMGWQPGSCTAIIAAHERGYKQRPVTARFGHDTYAEMGHLPLLYLQPLPMVACPEPVILSTLCSVAGLTAAVMV
ncbi:uncharacterized protein [Dermacentor albipictus]|uniref:uncharacterized protein n=1 Tax=Dermacentor albipictus TaxID=60249 RepID=UPI0038FCFE87